jgi:HTH-type transcriptional regulator / antitoxin HigA
MEILKYTVIKNNTQYFQYCDMVWALVTSKSISSQKQDEIELLEVLIEKYDNEHWQIGEFDPVELLKSLMENHNLKAKDLSEFLNVSKGYISEILNYKKGFSKEIVRKLADRFKVRQEAFNKPYKLTGNITSRKKGSKGNSKRKPRVKSYQRIKSLK